MAFWSMCGDHVLFETRVDQKIFDFNLFPIDYIDPSWLEASQVEIVARLASSSDSSARDLCSKWLLEQFGLSSAYDFDFSSPLKRVLLLDKIALLDVSFCLGLSALFPTLKMWVSSASHKRLNKALSPSLYSFYCSSIANTEKVTGFDLSEEKIARIRNAAYLKRTALYIGASYLFESCGGFVEPSVRRAGLKLLRPVNGLYRCNSLDQDQRHSVAQFAIGTVIRERHPSWHWLF
jgi:YOP proteins translocation protein K (YscK)